MNTLQILAASLPLLSLIACAAPGGDGSPVIRSLAKGGFSGIQEDKRIVVKDTKEWEKILALHTRTSRNAPPIPKVDLTKEMVLVATMGTKRTGGYSIEIVGVEAVGKKLRVAVKETSPPKGAMTIQALTAPFHFVAVRRSDLNVEFVDAPPAPKK